MELMRLASFFTCRVITFFNFIAPSTIPFKDQCLFWHNYFRILHQVKYSLISSSYASKTWQKVSPQSWFIFAITNRSNNIRIFYYKRSDWLISPSPFGICVKYTHNLSAGSVVRELLRKNYIAGSRFLSCDMKRNSFNLFFFFLKSSLALFI